MGTPRLPVWRYEQAILACNRWARRASGSGEDPSGHSRMLPPMGWRATGRRLPLAGAGVAGGVAGHTLAYALYVPDPGTRLAVLASSGHTYWSAAVAAAMVLGLVSIGTTVLSRFRAGLEPGHLGAGEPLARLAVRLTLLQMTIYLVQEALERLAVGVPLNDAVDGRLVLSGVVIQILVAVALAVLVTWVGRVAEVAGQAWRRRRRIRSESLVARPRPAARVRPVLLLVPGLGGRAPPLS